MLAVGEKEKASEWSTVIDGALDLVIRMERDRQETLQKLRGFITHTLCTHMINKEIPSKLFRGCIYTRFVYLVKANVPVPLCNCIACCVLRELWFNDLFMYFCPLHVHVHVHCM